MAKPNKDSVSKRTASSLRSQPAKGRVPGPVVAKGPLPSRSSRKRALQEKAHLGGPDYQEVRIGFYDTDKGVVNFLHRLLHARPTQIMDAERSGVSARLLKDLATEIDIPLARLYKYLGVSKATVEVKAPRNEPLTGTGGQQTLALARLLNQARGIVARSKAPEARGFDASRWFGTWLETPQPALGGRTPAEFLDTPTGIETVARTLGAIESGAYL